MVARSVPSAASPPGLLGRRVRPRDGASGAPRRPRQVHDTDRPSASGANLNTRSAGCPPWLRVGRPDRSLDARRAFGETRAWSEHEAGTGAGCAARHSSHSWCRRPIHFSPANAQAPASSSRVCSDARIGTPRSSSGAWCGSSRLAKPRSRSWNRFPAPEDSSGCGPGTVPPVPSGSAPASVMSTRLRRAAWSTSARATTRARNSSLDCAPHAAPGPEGQCPRQAGRAPGAGGIGAPWAARTGLRSSAAHDAERAGRPAMVRRPVMRERDMGAEAPEAGLERPYHANRPGLPGRTGPCPLAAAAKGGSPTESRSRSRAQAQSASVRLPTSARPCLPPRMPPLTPP